MWLIRKQRLWLTKLVSLPGLSEAWSTLLHTDGALSFIQMALPTTQLDLQVSRGMRSLQIALSTSQFFKKEVCSYDLLTRLHGELLVQRPPEVAWGIVHMDLPVCSNSSPPVIFCCDSIFQCLLYKPMFMSYWVYWEKSWQYWPAIVSSRLGGGSVRVPPLIRALMLYCVSQRVAPSHTENAERFVTCCCPLPRHSHLEMGSSEGTRCFLTFTTVLPDTPGAPFERLPRVIGSPTLQ